MPIFNSAVLALAGKTSNKKQLAGEWISSNSGLESGWILSKIGFHRKYLDSLVSARGVQKFSNCDLFASETDRLAIDRAHAQMPSLAPEYDFVRFDFTELYLKMYHFSDFT